MLGDINSVGMAASMVTVPNSMSSIESNPAALPMTMGSVSAQINSNTTHDERLHSGRITAGQGGLAVNPPPWGFAISYYSPSFEGGSFFPQRTNGAKDIEVSMRQYRASVARAFNDLSLSLSLELDHATRMIGSESYGDTAISYKIGSLYRLPKHFLVGLSVSPPLTVGSSLPDSSPQDLPGFAQPIKYPLLISTGIGWMPNRFFRAGFSLIGVGTTRGTALLRDQSVEVGNAFTMQPRLGASYVIAEYKSLKIEAAAGTYYEVSRIQGLENRLHGTFGIDVNPWFINTGFGFDLAKNYKNVVLSVGLDIVRTLRTFEIIPPDPVPPYNGFLPKPHAVQPDGLPDELTKGEEKTNSAPSVGDVKEIIENIPKRIGEKLSGGKNKKSKKKNSSRR